MNYLFFSYARKDDEAARKHVEELRANGFNIWQDVRNLSPGAGVSGGIRAAIESPQCEGFLLHWSKHAAASTWVRQELEIALDKHKTIYPIWLDGEPLPPGVTDINAVKPNELDRLIQQLGEDAPKTRRHASEIYPDDALKDWPAAKPFSRSIKGIQYFEAPLVDSSCSEAVIITDGDVRVEEPQRILLCIQLTGKKTPHFLADAITFFKDEYPGEPCIVIHVRSKETRIGEYFLDDQNGAGWQDTAYTCIEAVYHIAPRFPEIHLFAMTPVIFTALFGTRIPKGMSIYFYNHTEASDGRGFTYSQVGHVLKR